MTGDFAAAWPTAPDHGSILIQAARRSRQRIRQPGQKAAHLSDHGVYYRELSGRPENCIAAQSEPLSVNTK
jgi:hypothetical protein